MKIESISTPFKDTEEVSSKQETKAGRGLKKGLRILGVVFPLAAGQGNAFAGNAFQTDVPHKETATEQFQAEEVKMLELKSFGGKENISREEWKILQKYNFIALWGEKEILNTYGILPGGHVVEVLGETVLGHLGSLAPSLKQLERLKETYPEAQVVSLHQHPVVNGYQSGVLDSVSGTAVFAGTNIEDIREKRVFSAFPPSYLDMITAARNPDAEHKVVDANGIWAYGIDKNSVKGRGLLARINTPPSIFDAALYKYGLGHSDSERMQEYIAKGEWERAVEKEPGVATNFKDAAEEAMKTTVLWVTGNEDPLKYQDRQLNVAKVTANKKEWEKKIVDFIAYCQEQGLRVTYTPFQVSDATVLSPDMTPQQIDQVAKNAVNNYEQHHE